MLAEEDLMRHHLAAFEVPPGGPQRGTEVLPAGGPQRGEEGIFGPASFANINPDMGAGSLSFSRGNALTYDSDRGDVQAAEHQRNTGLAPASGVHDLAFGVSSGGYKVPRRHQEMGVEGDGCGGRDLVDRAPGTQMFCPTHQMEMERGIENHAALTSRNGLAESDVVGQGYADPLRTGFRT
jgi:hypothetical protein